MLRWSMDDTTVGSTEWCIFEMKRLGLVPEAIADVKKCLNTKTVDSTICIKCNVMLHYDVQTGDRICKSCGYAWQVILDTTHTFNDRKAYNQNPIHHYTISEHFSQSLVDLANIGNRSVPNDVMNFCRVALGRGLHVSSMKVFDALQQMGYRAYYQYKYEIANRLRGKREFVFTSNDIQNLRDAFNRYRNEMIPFQELYEIGSKSKNGKRRIFWPMRFILSRLCEEIGREDVIGYIRKIACEKRYDVYMNIWLDFVNYVDQRYPKPTRVKLQLRPLKQSKHRPQ